MNNNNRIKNDPSESIDNFQDERKSITAIKSTLDRFNSTNKRSILQSTPLYESSIQPQDSNIFQNNNSLLYPSQSEQYQNIYQQRNVQPFPNLLASNDNQQFQTTFPINNQLPAILGQNSQTLGVQQNNPQNYSINTEIQTENSSKLTYNGNPNRYMIPEVCLPKLQNIVSTLNLKCALDLREIALKARNAEYNPKRFAAVIMRIREPKTTALIFASGKMVCTGARNEEDSRKASRQFAKIIRKLGFNVKFTEFKIQNIVGSCDIKFPIRLEGLASDHAKFCNYEPEIFPGLIYRMIKPKIVLLIFVSGKIVLTGAKERDDIYTAFESIYAVLLNYKKRDEIVLNNSQI